MQNLKKILKADPEQLQHHVGISGSKMDHCPEQYFFLEKPLMSFAGPKWNIALNDNSNWEKKKIQFSCTSWPLSLWKFFLKNLKADPEL